ncbi:helix-turn-helix domain-containing protein [Rhodococcus sp. 11-3]|uniref:helix-turn-helix domain-containing protein n=1 Tax=Rhodococcus sp. 11-3 TaxID=2854796 RepID=UPI00203BDD01|nr:helix-turn-helix domain-containing protein [Rhodococcus sp. 11-3]USC16212.1 hypothetical protein KZJ41_04620 [Rhodococcus sp. 11-3]
MTCKTPGCSRGGQTRRGMCRACHERWRLRQHAYGRFQPLVVDAEPARRHITAMRDIGLTWRTISNLSGVDRKQVADLCRGAKMTSRDVADRILATRIPTAAHEVAPDDGRVPAIGTTRRIQALVANGWTQSYIAEQVGITVANMVPLTFGRQHMVQAAKARTVAALFERLQLEQGPSTRARNIGRKYGWALPLEWDDDAIDNPDATPIVSRRTKRDDFLGPVIERREKVLELTRNGLSIAQIADQLGVDPRTITRDRGAAA